LPTGKGKARQLLPGFPQGRGELLLPTSRVFDNLYPSGLPRSQPPIKEGNHGQVHVPHTPSPKNDPDALLGSPAVFFVRRRECGSAKIIE
jgi:hypothetical protein